MSDLISRQAAIDIFDDYNVSVENGELEAYSRDRKRLCNLPSAQQPTAKWVGEYGELYDDVMIATTNCSLCKESVVTKMVIPKHFEIDFEYKYCPNCGAKMEDER